MYSSSCKPHSVRNAASEAESPKDDCAGASSLQERGATSGEEYLVGDGPFDALPHLVCVTEPDGRIYQFNTPWLKYVGGKREKLQGAPWFRWVHENDRERALDCWSRSQASDALCKVMCRLRHCSGSYFWFLILAKCHHGDDGEADHWHITFTDIDQEMRRRLALEESARNQEDMLNVSVDCIKIINCDGTVRHMNRSGCIALGVPEDEERFGMKWLALLPQEVRGRGNSALAKARHGKKSRFAGLSVQPGKRPQHWDNILTPVKDESGITTSILCVSREVTLQREAERRLRVASEIDELTGLPNRRSFNSRLKRAIGQAREVGDLVGLMIIDLDHFKHVNDTLGHPAGDHLLRVFSKRLQSSLGASNFAARLGGDEFVVIVSKAKTTQDIVEVAEQVLQQMDSPISYGGKPINSGMSLGCAIFPQDAGDASGLMKCADTAVNDLKKTKGRGGISMFTHRMLEAVQSSAAQLSLAREIVRSGVVHPHYQPKVQLDNRHVVGFEALLRWRSPSGAVKQSPGDIWEAFKDYELATRLADMMHRAVFADLSHWLDSGLTPVPISINTAAVEFLRDDYAERLLEKLEKYRIPKDLLEIEVTEQVLSERGAEYVARALRMLRDEGLRITLDDFGTGNASFTHILDYPVTCLKIDQSFVRRMVSESPILAIVQTIGKLGLSLGLDVVAEGVEADEQVDILMEAGCRIGQGFLFGKAMDGQRVMDVMLGQSLSPAVR
jgi:diguanylate cyclase (GGDEF)-like protein/PAS domain S-box-containing protein